MDGLGPSSGFPRRARAWVSRAATARSSERRSSSMSSTPETFVDLEFVVERNYSNWRLDKYICQKLPRLSRTKVQRIIDRGLISDRALKSSTLVFPGLSFRMRRQIFDEPETPTFAQEVYRDRAILVIDKPAGLPTNASARCRSATGATLSCQRSGARRAL